jgi:hypothetical protein
MAETIPTDFSAALKKAGLLPVFSAYPPSHQREHLKWIGEAKKPETRLRRIDKAIEMIAAKQKVALQKKQSVAKHKFKIGDKIKITGHRPAKYPPGVVDELRTEELFKSMVGRRYIIRGFDRYGNVELQPKRLETVWIEPDLVELVK